MKGVRQSGIFKCKFHQQTKDCLSTIICLPYSVASNYQGVTDISLIYDLNSALFRFILVCSFSKVWIPSLLKSQKCACAWYSNLPISLKNKLHTAQNTCIRFCLGMKRRNHIGLNHFEKSNWLPAKNRVDQFIVTTAYNSKYNLSPVDLRFETWND